MMGNIKLTLVQRLIFAGLYLLTLLPYKAKRLYLLTLQVSRYCPLTLQRSLN